MSEPVPAGPEEIPPLPPYETDLPDTSPGLCLDCNAALGAHDGRILCAACIAARKAGEPSAEEVEAHVKQALADLPDACPTCKGTKDRRPGQRADGHDVPHDGPVPDLQRAVRRPAS